MLDHGPGVGLQPAHGAPDVPVDLDNLLDRRGLEQGGGDALLDAQDHAVASGDADGGAAQLDGLERVLDLEEAALGGEGAVCGAKPVSCFAVELLRYIMGAIKLRGYVCIRLFDRPG